MNHSLQKRLSHILIVTVVGCGVLATAAAFYFAYSEAEEFQDDTLKQISALAANARTQPDSASATAAIEDPESRVQVVRTPDGPSAAWLPEKIEPGFHTLPAGASNDELRVFVRKLKQGHLIAVSQPTASRNEIAINSALRTLIPLVILIPILIWMITRVTRSEFASVTNLAEELDRQATDLPVNLPDTDVPLEITPFVHAINRLLQRVDQLINTQRRFIADAAHELRTPLTALSLQAQNLGEAKTLEAMQDRLDPLREGIERAHRLTVQLLDLARLQSSETPREPVDVSVLVREVVADLYPIALSKRIDIGVDDSGVGTINSSPRALTLILRNGLENALKYTPAGGAITIQINKSDGVAAIEVLDNGPGLNEDELAHAFEPFFRLPDAKGEGSGLGLAIAMEAAARIGGVLELRNRSDGPGTQYRYSQSIA